MNDCKIKVVWFLSYLSFLFSFGNSNAQTAGDYNIDRNLVDSLKKINYSSLNMSQKFEIDSVLMCEYKKYGDVDSVIKYGKRAVEITVEPKHYKGEGIVYLSLAWAYKILLEQKEYFVSVNNALKAFEKIGDLSGIAESYYWFGRYYSEFNEKDFALKYSNLALISYGKLNDSLGVGRVYTIIGQYHNFSQNYDSAYFYYMKSMRILKKYGSPLDMMRVLGHLAYNRLYVGNPGEMIDLLLESEKYLSLVDNNYSRGDVYTDLGRAYRENSKPDSSEKYLLLAEKEISNDKITTLKRALLIQLLMLYISKEDFTKASSYAKQLISVTYDLYNKQRNEAIKMADLYKASEREKYESILNKESAEKKLIVFILAGLVLTILVLSLVIANRIKNKHNLILIQKNKEIEEKGSQLEEKNEKLNQINERIEETNLELEISNKNLAELNLKLELANKELESFSHSISHDLRAPLRAISGFVQIIHDDFYELSDEEKLSYLKRVFKASERMDTLITELLKLFVIRGKELNITQVNISQIAGECVENYKLIHPDQNILFTCSQDILVRGDKTLLTAVIENLIGNALKYSSKQDISKVEFGIKTNTDNLTDENSKVYFVKDNGAGFDMNQSKKLFTVFSRLHSNDEFEGTGVGLANASAIIHKHGGRIWAESEIGNGATFFFTVGESF